MANVPMETIQPEHGMMHVPNPIKCRAVLVGVSEYAEAWWPALPGVNRNVIDLQRVLTNPALAGWPADNCVTLINPRNATEVLDAVEAAAAAADDTVLVYYAGHGWVTDTDLLLPLPTTTGDRMHRHGVPYSTIRTILWHRRARHAVVLLDCCLNGTNDTAAFADRLIGQTNAFTLISSAPDAASLAPPGERHTAFTGQLLNVLTLGVPEAGDHLSLTDIARATSAGLADRWLPPPRFSRPEMGDRFALVRNGSKAGWRASVGFFPGSEQPAAPAEKRHINDPAAVNTLIEYARKVTFSTTMFRPGYNDKEVDAFIDRLIAGLEGRAEPLTADDVRDVRFSGTKFRSGYDEQDVDHFLEIVEERLRALRLTG